MTGAKATAPVTVVIPCYRCADTVDRAVESVVRQSLRPAELILVDDCSADGTLVELERLRNRHGEGWIRVLALPRNAGPGGARNAGWDAATQTYVAFLDADDAWAPSKIELQCGWMLQNRHAILTAHARVLAAGSSPARVLVAKPVWREVSPRRMLWRNPIATSAVMVCREIVLRFDPARRYSEDYWLWLQIAFAGAPIYVSQAPLAVCHKPDFGAGGLSARLWKMEAGELTNLRLLRKQHHVGVFGWAAASAWSLIRHARRVLVTTARGTGRSTMTQHSDREPSNRVRPGRHIR